MPEPWIGLMVALGCGLLVGIERERRKGHGPARGAAGMRTFTLVTVAGGLAQTVGAAELVAAGAIAVALLAALAYWRTSQAGAGDPGLTTEVALLVAYLVGVLCVRQPALGAACGAVLAALLAARENMHRFATEWLREVELRDALVLAAVALVLVPLAPTTPWPWLGGLTARTAAMLIMVILALQAAAHVAQRLLGPRYALALSGLLGGFVSSTATIATLGGQARSAESPTALRGLAGAAALSGAATWLQALALCAVASPGLWSALIVPAGAGLVAAVLGAWAVGWRAAPGAPAVEVSPERRPLRLREALTVAALLLVVAAVVAWAQSRWGSSGLWVGTALTAMADAHSPIAAVMALHHSGIVSTAQSVHVVLLAVSVNTASRCVVATLTGGVRYASWVGAVLVSSAAAAWIAGTLAR